MLAAPAVGSWWAAGSGLSAVTPLLEGFLVTPLAQSELGQCDLALPCPLGHLLEMTQTPLSHNGARCVQPLSVLGGRCIKERYPDLFFPSRRRATKSFLPLHC